MTHQIMYYYYYTDMAVYICSVSQPDNKTTTSCLSSRHSPMNSLPMIAADKEMIVKELVCWS